MAARHRARGRYRLEVLFDAYGATTTEALAGLERLTERGTSAYAGSAASQPTPRPSAGSGGRRRRRAAGRDAFVGEIGNLGAASLGLALAIGLDARGRSAALAFGYGGGEGIAQAVEVTAGARQLGRRGRSAGEAIDLGAYYRWTRGRQAEPH